MNERNVKWKLLFEVPVILKHFYLFNRDKFNFHSGANEIFSQIISVEVLLLLFFEEKKKKIIFEFSPQSFHQFFLLRIPQVQFVKVPMPHYSI